MTFKMCVVDRNRKTFTKLFVLGQGFTVV